MIKLNLKPEARIIGQFAWFAVVGLPLIAWFVLRLFGAFSFGHIAFLVAAGVGVLQLVLFLAGVKAVSRALFVGLSVAFVPIGFVISHVLMMLIYYLVLTPIALVFRLIGRDVIGKRIERDKATYWHERPGVRPPASYFKLY